MDSASNAIATASNMISLIRLMLTIPICWALIADCHILAFWLCIIAAFSDWLDGFVARRTNTVSEWGKIIDPVADKVLVGAVVVVLLSQQLLPVWFVAAVLSRDLIILAGGFIAKRYTPIIPPSLWSGKLAVCAIAAAGLASILHWTTVTNVAIGLSTLLMTLSLWHYGKRLHGIIRQTQENP